MLYCDVVPLLNYIVSRLYLIYLVVFIFLFFYYLVIVISQESDDKLRIKSIILKILVVSFVILTFLIFKLPLYYNNMDGMVYSYGPAANVVYVLATLCMSVWTISLFINRKKVNKKKSVPIIAFIIGAMITTIIQKINPGLLLMTSMETFVIVVMYFTIENPDMKLLEEVHKSKEISDNANEEKTIFLYNMTQEIRKTTGEINNSADMILESDSLEEDKEMARDIKATTSSFSAMTNEILDVSRIDAASVKIYNNKYNLKNMLKQIVSIYNEVSINKNLEFRTNIDHNIPELLYGDSINLKEVMTIILNNSIKYTDKGYVELSVNTIIKNDICRLIITVEDSGNGIKSEDLKKVRIDNVSLSKANKLITLMNGAMLISSNYGFGTKVKIILDQRIGEVENNEVSKYDNEFENISILMIDDNESGIKIVEKLLRGSNIKLDTSMNGKDSLVKIKSNKYDLILLDEELSQITGEELLKKIKEIRNKDIPVILLSKDNSYEYNEEYKKQGFVDYILKPIKKDILLEKISKCLGKDD